MGKSATISGTPVPGRSWTRLLGTAVTWESIAAVVVLGVLVRHPGGYAIASLVLIAAVALGIPFGRITGVQRIARRLHFGRRARNKGANPALPVDMVPLGEWVPGLTVSQTRSARGDDVGVITDGSSWTALLGISSDNNLFADRDDSIELAALRGLTVQDDIVFAALQVITYTVPAPATVMLSGNSAAAASYTQILHEPVPPAVRRTWIGVRLDPRLCLEAVASRGASNDGIYATLRFGLHRVQSALKRQGITTHELTALEIYDVLALTAGASPDFGEVRSTESWTHWDCDGFAHCGRQITGWGSDPSAGYQAVLNALGSARVIFGVASYTLDRTDHATGGVRVVSPTAGAATAAMGAIQAELSSRVGFGPAGGDQVPAMLATVPLGREVEL